MNRLRIVRKLRDVSPAIRLLALTDFVFAIGFHMLIPFLAARLSALGMAAWAIGLVLGFRQLSQQGLYLFGGALADRTDYKRVMVAGCVLRAVGFFAFAFARSPLALAGATAIIGLAAALLLPAMKAYLSHESGADPEAFALSEVLQQAGVLLGPLFGMALLRVDFQWVALVAGGLSIGWAVWLANRLPRRAGTDAGSEASVAASWLEIARAPGFLPFCGVMTAYAVLINQLYLCLPLALVRSTGRPSSAGWIFALSGGVVVAGQMYVAEICRKRFGPSRSIALGLGVMGAAFVPLAVAQASSFAAGPAIILATVAILTLGMKAVFPFTMQLIPEFGTGRGPGAQYGMFYLAWGIGGTLGNAAAGRLFERSPLLAWTFFALIGWLAAGVLLLLRRRRLIPDGRPAGSSRAEAARPIGELVHA